MLCKFGAVVSSALMVSLDAGGGRSSAITGSLEAGVCSALMVSLDAGGRRSSAITGSLEAGVCSALILAAKINHHQGYQI